MSAILFILIIANARADDGSAVFEARCAGCHTIGEGAKAGPDLLPAANWPEEELSRAIVRMESYGAKLSDDERASLLAWLPTASTTPEVDAGAASSAAPEPVPPVGDAERGAALFTGQAPLSGGGPACSACHSLRGSGGTLAVNLDGYARGKDASTLVPVLRAAAFPVMREAYADHPLTDAEAADLASWLGTTDRRFAASVPEWALSGGVVTGLFALLGMGALVRGRTQPARRHMHPPARTRQGHWHGR